MEIKATILIDDDRWAKRPFGVRFDDPECNRRFGANDLTTRESCERRIEMAIEAGYDIDPNIEDDHY